MSTIDWLLRKHNSDKEVFHGYGALYEEYFNSLKDEEITLFEIGVQGGHSIKPRLIIGSKETERVFYTFVMSLMLLIEKNLNLL